VGFVASAIEVMLPIRAGRLAEAEALAQTCAERGTAAGDIDVAGWHGAQLVAIRWYQGRLIELLPMLNELVHSATLSAVDNGYDAVQAMATALAGDRRTAASMVARLSCGVGSAAPPSGVGSAAPPRRRASDRSRVRTPSACAGPGLFDSGAGVGQTTPDNVPAGRLGAFMLVVGLPVRAGSMSGLRATGGEVSVGRPEKPVDPDAGPVQRLAWQLRRLRERAGSPSYRRLAQRAHYSASTLADAAKGERLASLEVTLAYVAACGGDLDEWRVRWSAAAETSTGSAVVEREDERCPYRGLTAFQPEEAGWFFGRAQLVHRLLERIGRLPLVGVFGASGSGKSSLLRAGLLGTIAADDKLAGRWRTLLMTPTEHPVRALAEAVAKLCDRDLDGVSEELAGDPAALDIAVRTVLAAGPAESRVLLVVDQFEEVFTLCADEGERVRFIDALVDASRAADSRTTVVVGVRADFLAHVMRYAGLLDALVDEAQLLVGPVSAADLREIITCPAARVGLHVEPDLVTVLLADAAGQPGALPLVSHALLETWHRRTDGTLTLSAYQASGGVRAAIAQTAERVHAEFDPGQQAVARRIFLRLTALGDGTEDTRRPIARSELDGIADETVTAVVLTRLADARLVVLGEGTVEVAHEALIRAWPRLHRWLTDDRAALILHRRLTDAAQTWLALDRDSGALFRGAQMYGARAWATDHPGELNRLESSFLRASEALAGAEQDSARRRARLLNRLVAGISVLLVLAVLGGGLAVVQRQEARHQEQAAVADELSLRARALLATDPDFAGLLAVEADRLSPSTETHGAVLSAAAAQRSTRLNVGGPPVYSITFSPDDSLLAAADAAGSIEVWDPRRGTRVATLASHTSRALAVAFNRDGSRLAATGIDGTVGSVLVWDVGTRRQVLRLSEDGITGALAFSANGTKLAVGVGNGDVALHDLGTGSRRVLHGPGRPVTSLTFSADARLLVSADGQGYPRVWDVSTGTVLADLAAEHVFSVFFGPSGRVLSGSADDKGVYLWDLGGARPVPLPPLPLQGQYGWTVSAPVGDQVAVADENGAIALWDFRRRVRLQTFQDRGRTETISVVLSPDGAMLASAGFNGTIVVHDLSDNPFGGFDARVRDIRVSPDGSLVAVAGSDRTVRLYDPQGRPLATLGGHADEVQAVAFSPDGRLLAAVTRNVTITIWDVQRRQHAVAPFPGQGIGASTDVAFDPSGKLLATATLGAYVWDVHNLGAPVDVSSRYPSRLSTSLAFTPDGRRLVSAGARGLLNVWDTATGKLLASQDTHQGALQDLAISPDGRLFATAGDSRTIKFWDASTLTEIATLSGHTAPIQVLAFSHDGRTLASAGDDQTVVVWDVPTRTHVVTLTGHRSRIRGLAFTPDGTLLSGDEDGRIIHWTLDVPAATARICAATGRGLTRQEWAANLGSRPYKPTCKPPA
jgi:WD40 repeat protein